MLRLELTKNIIPAYDYATESDRELFEASEAGLLLKAFLDKYEPQVIDIQKKTSGLWAAIMGSYSDEKRALKEQIKEASAQLHKQLEAHESYHVIKAKIRIPFLIDFCPDLEELPPEDLCLIASQKFSHELDEIIDIRNEKFKYFQELHRAQVTDITGLRAIDLRCSINLLEEEESEIKARWLESFNKSLGVKETREKLNQIREKQKEEHRISQRQLVREYLVAFLENTPHLQQFGIKDRLDTLVDQIPLEALLNQTNIKELVKPILDADLTLFLQEKARQYFRFTDINVIHQRYARTLVKHLLDAFDCKTDVDLSNWQVKYQQDIFEAIKKSLIVEQDQTSVLGQKDEDSPGLLASLSYLFLQNKTVESVKNFTNRLADTHAFIQATGFSSQSDNSFMAILDFYNYNRYQESIDEHRKIVSSILSPFMPIYYEYKNLANYEKSTFRKVVRIVMPMIILASFTIVVGALLSSLAIAESAFLVALIPTLYIGAYLSALYVSYKDKLALDYEIRTHGGPFEIPEYQVNDRMLHIFGDKDIAEQTRATYIQEIQRCDQIEATLKPRAEAGTLDSKNLELRKENIKLRHTLQLEWYDIHSNAELGIEAIPQIILNRLQTIQHREMQTALKEIESEAGPSLKQHIEQYLSKVSEILNITKPQKQTEQDHVPVDSPREPLRPSQEIKKPTASSKNPHGFFNPSRLLQHRCRVQEAHKLAENIRVVEQPLICI